MKSATITIVFYSIFVLFFFAAHYTFPEFPAGPEDNQSAPLSASVPESRLKAALISQYISYLVWPANSTAANPDTLFIIGALAENDITSFLVEIAKTKKIGDRQVKILIISDDTEIKNCNTLYISGISEKRLQKILEIVDNLPILTVTDVPHFKEKGVMINMFNEGNKIKCNVNLTKIRKNGIRLRPSRGRR